MSVELTPGKAYYIKAVDHFGHLGAPSGVADEHPLEFWGRYIRDETLEGVERSLILHAGVEVDPDTWGFSYVVKSAIYSAVEIPG